MAEHLFLRFGDSTDRVAVARLNADGQLLGRPETMDLAAAAARCDGALVTVLLPAREIVSCTASLPATSVTRQRQMLPFSLEDEFAGDVDDLHFALGSSNDAGAFAVSVIDRRKLGRWLEALGAAGIVARRIFSEADGVADTPGVTTLYLENDRIFGRRPGGAPFVFDELALPDVWKLLQSERDEQADLGEVVLLVDSETLRSRGDEIDAWRAGVANVNLKELADGALPRLAATLVFREGPNLLQGRFAPKSNYASLLRPWRVAAGFVVAVVASPLSARQPKRGSSSRTTTGSAPTSTRFAARATACPSNARASWKCSGGLPDRPKTAAAVRGSSKPWPQSPVPAEMRCGSTSSGTARMSWT